jgi:hypothetical protein
MDSDWNEIKKKYKIGTFCFAFGVVINFFSAPTYELADLTKKRLSYRLTQYGKKDIIKEPTIG